MARKKKEAAGNESLFFRSIEIDARSLDEDKREIEVSFSSETDKVRRWFGTEILSHRKGAVDLSRLKVGAHLFNHNADQIIGPIKDSWVEEGRGKAVVGYDETEEGDRAFKRTKNKSLKGISVGYIPLKALVLEEGQKWEGETKTVERKGGEEPVYIITKWAPIEISSTPIPADPDVGIGREMTRSLDGIEIETLTDTREEKEMDKVELMAAIREVMQEMPKPLSIEDVENVVKRLNQPKEAVLSINLEQHKELLARADAISPQAVSTFAQMVSDGRDYLAIQGELLKLAVGKTDAAGKPGPGADGTGRDEEAAGKRAIEAMDDDHLIRMITQPTHDLLQ